MKPAATHTVHADSTTHQARTVEHPRVSKWSINAIILKTERTVAKIVESSSLKLRSGKNSLNYSDTHSG